MHLIATVTTVLAMISPFIVLATKPPAFTIEWHEITPQTYQHLRPTLEALEPVYVEAFLQLVKPYVYAYDPRVTVLTPAEQIAVEPKIIADITTALRSDWVKRLEKIENKMCDKNWTPTYLAIAIDGKQNVLGFAFFFNSPIEDELKAEKFTITNGTFPTGKKNHMYVAPVAVRTNSPILRT